MDVTLEALGRIKGTPRRCQRTGSVVGFGQEGRDNREIGQERKRL